MTTARIIGLGNRFRGDDAVGPLAAEKAAASGLPPGVEAVEAGGDPFALLDLIMTCRRAVIVDAAEMGAAPGTVRVLRDEAIPSAWEMHTSLHAVDLCEVIAMARKMGTTARLSLVAVQPGACGYHDGLSPAVQERIVEITSLALKEAVNEA